MKIKKNGFTLLEVMLSMVIFTVLAIGTMNAMPMVKRGSVTRLDHTQAMLILEQRMAEIRRDYAGSGIIVEATLPAQVLALREGVSANLTTTVTGMDGAADDALVGLKHVQLALAWTNSSNVSETVELNGLLFRG